MLDKRLKIALTIGLCAATSFVHAQEYVGAANNPNLFLNPQFADSKQTTAEETAILLKEQENGAFAAENKEMMQLGFAIGVSDMEFQKIPKDDLPVAPKDQAGEYYLDLDSPHKAVNLPTKFGNIPVNLDTMRYRQKMSDIQRGINQKIIANGGTPSALISPKNMSYPVYGVYISFVSSANFDNPYTSGIELDSPGSSFNHGGSWVGAVSQEIGLGTAYAMNICGVPAPYTHSIGVTYYQNGQPMGYWRGMFTQSGCQNGWIQSAASGANGTVYSSPVYFY